jgi:hypothetical protein
MKFTKDDLYLMRNGMKTQVRLPVKAGEACLVLDDTHGCYYSWNKLPKGEIDTVVISGLPGAAHCDVRRKWSVGKTYAVQTDPGKRAIPGRIRITDIRRERACDISDKDVPAEGLRWDFDRGRWVYGDTVLERRDAYPAQNIAAFLFLWRSTHKKAKNEDLCGVLTFDVVGK